VESVEENQELSAMFSGNSPWIFIADQNRIKWDLKIKKGLVVTQKGISHINKVPQLICQN